MVGQDQRFMSIDQLGAASLSSLTIRDFSGDVGGAIKNAGDLTISRVKFAGNRAAKGAAIYNSPTGAASFLNFIFSHNTGSHDVHNAGVIYTGHCPLTFSMAGNEVALRGQSGQEPSPAQGRLMPGS
jgi:hypothetical protein